MPSDLDERGDPEESQEIFSIGYIKFIYKFTIRIIGGR